MNISYKQPLIALVLCLNYIPVFSQNTPENLKTALVYRIANCVKWNSDTSSVFTVGILSNNQKLLDKFNELTKIARIHKKRIRIISFSDINSIQPTHLLYVDRSREYVLSSILKKLSKQTLVISDEHDQPGEIMINLMMDKKTSAYTFEYNRANIIFAGLELAEEIILLKGTEIEIREMYLQAKKLWDDQQAVVAELKNQGALQNINIANKNDSIQEMKRIIGNIELKIAKQIAVLAQKDSLSNDLAGKIKKQQAEIILNVLQTNKLITERNANEDLIRSQDSTMSRQLALSDSLSAQITEKQQELLARNKILNEKETLIRRQTLWLIISLIIIAIVVASTVIISRAYVVNRRARRKIAEQKKELETTLEQLKNAQLQLIQSEKMASLGILIAGIAHEINNPVNFINTGVDGIEKVVEKAIVLFARLTKLTAESKGAEIQELLDLMQKLKFQRSLDAMPQLLANIKIGVARTIEITNGLRVYARMDTEGKSLCDINRIIDTSLLLINPRLNQEIEIEKNYGELPPIKALPGKLSQVFVNILNNAIDSILCSGKQPGKHSIRITTRTIAGTILLDFTDSGKGIPPEVLPKIFDPFYTTKIVGKGTGLGMSISQSIIEEHNGKLSAGNNGDHGATFRIEIPVTHD
jgi:signal transduction histidine kinase